MEDTTPEPEQEETSEVMIVGDAAELTEGTTFRSGTEDKRYKYK